MITALSDGYMALKIVKLCCRITHFIITEIPQNSQFPTMNVSPIVPHLTLTEETTISLIFLILFLSIVWYI